MTSGSAKASKTPAPASNDGLRQAIIDAARRAFVEESYSGLTMRKIAARVGCTAGAIYGYFASREELLWHVWEREFEKVHVYTMGAVDQAKEPVEKVRQVFLSWARYFISHKEEFRVMFGWGSGSNNADKVKPRSRESGLNFSYHYALDLLRVVLKDAPRAPEDIDRALQCLLTATFGVIAMAHSPSQFPWFDPEEMTALSIDSILSGWGIDPRGRGQ